jgi:hypothetical protein
MSETTQLVDTAAVGDRRPAADLFPLVYDELRRLAERRGHTFDGALEQLAGEVPVAADLVKLRFFAGRTLRDTADALALSPRSDDRRLALGVPGSPTRWSAGNLKAHKIDWRGAATNEAFAMSPLDRRRTDARRRPGLEDHLHQSTRTD